MRKAIFLLLVFFIQFSSAQTTNLLKKAKTIFSAEQIFVHCDKANYLAGETIWMKMYLMNDDLPSTDNSSIKVQLISNDSSLVAEKVYPVVNSIATGNISLPIAVKEGRYFLRVFTNTASQKKYAKDFIAPILIYNPASVEKISETSFSYQSIPNIQFHAANYLVNGLINQSFVSIKDQFHQPVQTNGWLINGENDTITTFITDISGSAALRFIPNNTTSYKIKLADNKTETNISLPILANGTVMIDDYDKENYTITILSTIAANKNFHLIGESSNRVLFEVNAVNGQRIKIPTAELPTGIFRIVLTDENNTFITERFLFSTNERNIIPVKDISANIHISDTATSSVHLQAADTINTTVSLSLTDSEFDFAKNNQQENIINRFLLTAHLQGEYSAYNGLIENVSKADVSVLNNILATHTLLKPSWNEMLAAKENSNAGDTADYIKIIGAVKPDGFKKFPKDATLNLIFESKDSTKDFINTPVLINDKKGSIALKGLIFYDTLTLHYKLNDKNYQSVKLELEPLDPDHLFTKENKNDRSFLSFYSPQHLVRNNKPNNPDADKKELVYKNLSDEILTAQKSLPPVTVTSYKTWRQKAMDVSDRYGEDLFRREAEQMFDLVNSPYKVGTKSVSQYLKLFGRRMQVQGDDLATTNIIQWPVLWHPKPYTIFIDGGRVDFSDLDVIDISNVALIKVYTNFVLADENGPAIAVFTRHPEDKIIAGTNLQVLKLSGYNSGLIFMNPEKQYLPYIHKKNLLGTFYWSPFLYWNSEQKDMDLKLYNLNQVKEARLIVQGMSADGKLLYVNKIAEAK